MNANNSAGENRLIAFSGGKQLVSIGDKFKWDGVCPGQYEVISFGNSLSYSPSGLGGTPTVIVKNLLTEETDEWCGDSVANGIFHNRIESPTS